MPSSPIVGSFARRFAVGGERRGVAGSALAWGALSGVLLGIVPGRRAGAQVPAHPCAIARGPGTVAGTPAASAAAGPDAAVAPFRGRRIESVRVVPLGPDRVRGLLPRALHATTRAETIRRLLLFAPGDTVDPLRIAQSLRQLRAMRFLAGASVSAACEADGGIALTITTRDQWSLTPRLRVGGGPGGSANVVAGLEERNLLGTGRDARLHLRSDQGRVGAGVSYADPALFGGRYTGTLSRDVYRDGTAWGGLVRTRPAGAFERWGVGVAVRQSALQSVVRTPAPAPGDSVRRSAAALLVSHRPGGPPGTDRGGVTFLLGGLEAERTVLTAGVQSQVVGPVAVRRTFVGIDLGAARRSTRYVAVPWLVPSARATERDGRENPAELPLGTEADVLVGVGRDFAAHALASHVDTWVGRTFAIGARDGVPRALATADLWANGYHPLGRAAGGEWSAATVRAQFGAAMPAARGLWTGRVVAERLADPDPDLRGLAMTDPVLRALPTRTRFAEAALGAIVERSMHLRPVTHAFMLDGAVFGAASFRWDPAVPLSATRRSAALAGADPEHLTEAAFGPALAPAHVGVGSIGVGLRLVPTAFGRASVRFDVGMPVVRTAGVPSRPFFGITITPAFGLRLGRDGGTKLPTP